MATVGGVRSRVVNVVVIGAVRGRGEVAASVAEVEREMV